MLGGGGGGVNWADTGGIRDRRAHSPTRRSTSVGARRDRAGGPLLSRRPGATASSQLTPRRSLAESLRSTSQISPASSPSPTRHADALRSTFSASPDELDKYYEHMAGLAEMLEQEVKNREAQRLETRRALAEEREARLKLGARPGPSPRPSAPRSGSR